MLNKCCFIHITLHQCTIVQRKTTKKNCLYPNGSINSVTESIKYAHSIFYANLFIFHFLSSHWLSDFPSLTSFNVLRTARIQLISLRFTSCNHIFCAALLSPQNLISGGVENKELYAITLSLSALSRFSLPFSLFLSPFLSFSNKEQEIVGKPNNISFYSDLNRFLKCEQKKM